MKNKLFFLCVLTTVNFFSQNKAAKYIAAGDAKCNNPVYKKNDYKAAYANYSKAITSGPDSEVLSLAYYKRALVYKNNYSVGVDSSLADVSRAIKILPGFAEAYLLRIDLNYREPEKNDTIKQKIYQDYLTLLELKPTDPDLHYQFGLFQSDYLNKHEEGISEIKKSIELNPKNPTFYCSLANIHAQKLKNYKAAFIDCDNAIEADKSYSPVYEIRARLKAILKDFTGAIKDYDKAIEMEKDSLSLVYIYQEKATYCKEMADYTCALQSYDKMISYSSKFIEYEKTDFWATAYDAKAKINLILKKDTDAVENLDKAAALYATFDVDVAGELYKQEGAILYNLKHYDKAIEKFNLSEKLAYELSYSDSALYRMRGESYYIQKNYKKAFADFNHLISQSEMQEPYFFFMRGALNYFLKNFKESINDLTKAYSAGYATNAELNYIKGLDYLYLKNFENALIEFDKAIETDSKYAEAFYQRAGVKNKLGDQAGCCKDLVTADGLGLAFAKENLKKYCK